MSGDQACRCEHLRHFTAAAGGHRYGKVFREADLRKIRSKYGTWVVCSTCERKCFKEKEG